MRPTTAVRVLRGISAVAAVTVAVSVAGACGADSDPPGPPYPLPAGTLGATTVTATDPGGTPIGAQVVTVKPRSAATEAGLKAGDVIVEADGHEVTTAQQLEAQIARRHLAQGLRLTLMWPPGETRTVNLDLAR
ncbi:PDZ domain-containing protein [Pseudonocardia bannensis]|uniref:PDZ domain-containing protein n=1 Tax=Pseudonocardia bannensis TaxID=630973 RepID=A0A848DFF4_9PSEU|nr:PDZ domain-containing protein [Pseudonocardia bannensis]NMH91299.1 PDZ domain-containing protein [Pseudonocardia bannensis]